MKLNVKHVIAAISVAGALASVVAGREQPTYAKAVQPVARLNTRLPSVEDIDIGKVEEAREQMAEDATKVDAFAPRNFSPVLPPQAQAPAKKVAPPLPFRYLGKMIEDGKLKVFLARGEESLSVHAGQKLGEYRIDKVTDSEIVFTYLPLKTKQSLPL